MAIDGLTNQLFIVQARPETIHSQSENQSLVEYQILAPEPEKRILQGIAVGSKIATGKVVIMYSLDGRDGIDSISVTPDSVLKTIQTLARQEKTAAVLI
jgi:pyruvate,water dikinase